MSTAGSVVGLIGLIAAFILSSVIVNACYRGYMKLTGSDLMFFNRKTKLGFIIILGLVIFGVVGGVIVKLFGINI